MVISIIGLLSSIVLASLNTARVKARDTKRIADLRTIRNALELYRETNDKYPPASNWVFSTADNPWIPGLTSEYIKELPKDPTNVVTVGPWVEFPPNYTYAYIRAVNTNEYDLVTQFEDIHNPNRCELKCPKFHYFDVPWCGGSCAGNNSVSPYLFADH